MVTCLITIKPSQPIQYSITTYVIGIFSMYKVQIEALIPLKGNRLSYLGFNNSVVSTNLSRVNFKNLLTHNTSSYEEFPSQDLF